jgi:hypothetical protein
MVAYFLFRSNYEMTLLILSFQVFGDTLKLNISPQNANKEKKKLEGGVFLSLSRVPTNVSFSKY